jgi:hypothetical protein
MKARRRSDPRPKNFTTLRAQFLRIVAAIAPSNPRGLARRARAKAAYLRTFKFRRNRFPEFFAA